MIFNINFPLFINLQKCINKGEIKMRVIKLINSQLKIINKNKKIGFKVLLALVDISQKLHLPKHYREL